MKNKKISQKNKGFTIVETLISIFILTLAITGPIYISSFALRNTIESRDNISAQYLAEEVIEVIKNQRDEKILSNMSGGSTTHWINSIEGISNCFNATNMSDNKCMLKSTSIGSYTIEKCNGICENISFNIDGDIIYGSSEPSLPRSKFIREFYIQKGLSDPFDAQNIPQKEAKLIINIKWTDKGRDKIYTLTERLYNINYVDFFTK